MPDSVQGQGGDKALWLVILALVCRFKLGFSDAMTVALEYNQTKSQPRWPESKIEYKVRRALRMAGEPRPRAKVALTAAAADPARAAERWLHGFRCDEAELTAASPIQPPCDWRLAGAWIMPFLYLAEEQVNIVEDFALSPDHSKAAPQGRGATLSRDLWTERLSRRPTFGDAGAWIRLNPLVGRGVGDANVAAFRYGLLEFDSIATELQFALISRLPLPVAAIATSGGRSVHAWLRVDAPDVENFRDQMSRVLGRLAQFGVDTRTSNPSRLGRLPGAQRRIGATGDGRQRLLYLKPRPKSQPILGEPALPIEPVPPVQLGPNHHIDCNQDRNFPDDISDA
jgi:hypothetical protein